MNIETNADLPYSEASRRYRRTVYRHADWLEHRSSTRLFGNLSGTLTSGVVRSLLTEVAAVATISTLTCAWNGAVQGFVDWQSVPHDPILHLPSFLVARLPALPFTLASPALGLLLVFRTNASYARWVESRVAWGRVVSHCRNVMRQSSTWMREDVDPRSGGGCCTAFAARLGRFPGAWRRTSPVRTTSEDSATSSRCVSENAARIGCSRAPNRPLQALADLSRAVHQLPMDEKRRVEVDKSVILLGDALETCERIFTSPVPLVYTRHTARFLSCWLLLLPLALWEPFEDTWNHAAMIPSAARWWPSFSSASRNSPCSSRNPSRSCRSPGCATGCGIRAWNCSPPPRRKTRRRRRRKEAAAAFGSGGGEPARRRATMTTMTTRTRKSLARSNRAAEERHTSSRRHSTGTGRGVLIALVHNLRIVRLAVVASSRHYRVSATTA